MKEIILERKHDGAVEVSDAHFREKYNFPIDDIPQKFFDFLYDICIRNNYFLIFNGDTSDKRFLSAALAKFLASNFKRFRKAKLPIIINSGNHEIIDSYNSTFLSQYNIMSSGIHVFNEVGRVINGNSYVDVVPYMPLKYLRDVLSAITPIENKAGYLVGHFQVKGAYYVGTKSQEGITISELEKLGKKYKFILLGHFHKRQRLTRNCRYTGIPFHSAFEDEGFHSGVDIIDFKSGEVSYMKFDSPKFKTVIISSKKDLTDGVFEQNNNIVKVQIIGTQDSVANIGVEKIRKKFGNSGARMVLFPPPTIVREIKSRIEITSSMSWEEIVEKYVIENIPKGMPKKRTIRMFKELYEEVKMRQ